MTGKLEAELLPKSDFMEHKPCAAAKRVLYCVVGAGRFACDPELVWNKQIDSGVVFTYLEKGSGSLVVNNEGFDVKAGDFFLFDADDEYSFQTDGEVLWVHVEGGNCVAFCEMLKDVNGSVYRLMPDSLIPFMMRSIFGELKQKKPRDGIIGANISSVFCVLFDNASHVLIGKEHENDPVEHAIVYIRQHIAEKLPAEQIAKAVGVSAGHLRRLFKSKKHRALHEYVAQAKVDTARTLLKTTTKTVHEIAEGLGYASDASFSAAFKKHTQFSPTVFRQNRYG